MQNVLYLEQCSFVVEDISRCRIRQMIGSDTHNGKNTFKGKQTKRRLL